MTEHTPRPALGRLRELSDAATPGRWRAQGAPSEAQYVLTGGMDFLTGPIRPHDAALIVASVNALPVLLDIVKAARTLATDHETWVKQGYPEWLGQSFAALRTALEAVK